MQPVPYTKDHFFQLAGDALQDAETLFSAKSFRRGVNVLAEADEMVAKGLLCGIGFVYDQQDLTEIRDGMTRAGTIPPAEIETIIKQMAESVRDSKRKLLMTYGHEWTTKFLTFLEGIAEPVGKTAKKSGLAKMLSVPSQTPWLKSIWTFEGGKERVEKIKETLKDQARFRNPPLSDIELVLYSDNKLLDSLPDYRWSEETLNSMYQNMFQVPIPAGISVSPKMFQEAIGRTMGLIVAGDLSVYLSCHFQLARYLDEPTDFVYDKNLAVVKKHKEIAKLLKRCMI